MRKTGPIQLEHGSMSANIESYCKLLTLSSVADNYETMALDATKTKISYQEYLYKLLQQQIIDRVDRSVNTKIKMKDKLSIVTKTFSVLSSPYAYKLNLTISNIYRSSIA